MTRRGCRLLDRVRDVMAAKGKSTVPYADDNDAAFYRLPAGFRRAKKEIEKEEDGMFWLPLTACTNVILLNESANDDVLNARIIKLSC